MLVRPPGCKENSPSSAVTITQLWGQSRSNTWATKRHKSKARLVEGSGSFTQLWVRHPAGPRIFVEHQGMF